MVLLSTLPARLRSRPWLTLVGVVVVLGVLAYATLIQQELFLVVWFGFLAFFAHLTLRFVRATERLAGAAERLADRSE